MTALVHAARRLPVLTILIAVIIAQTLIIIMGAIVLRDIREGVTEVAVSARERAVEAEVRGQEALGQAMTCLTGLLLIPSEQRTDDIVHRVCPHDIIDGVRVRLGP